MDVAMLEFAPGLRVFTALAVGGSTPHLPSPTLVLLLRGASSTSPVKSDPDLAHQAINILSTHLQALHAPIGLTSAPASRLKFLVPHSFQGILVMLAQPQLQNTHRLATIRT
jgi:hypothetical protein